MWWYGLDLWYIILHPMHAALDAYRSLYTRMIVSSSSNPSDGTFVRRSGIVHVYGRRLL